MHHGKDYYQILDIHQGASDKEIKSAYRKLARKYHPDVNPGNHQAEQKFKEITEAYECLKDPEKKKLYDQYGSNWQQAEQFKNQQGGAGFQGHFNQNEDLFENIFSGFTGDFSHFFDNSDLKHKTNITPPKDIIKNVDVSLEEINTGCLKTITYTALDPCKSCSGYGKVKINKKITCQTCHGSGKVSQFPGLAGKCPTCKGSGSHQTENCPSCRASGTIATNRKVEVSIPKGISHGKKLRIPGRGSAGTGMKMGDLYVQVFEKKHPLFTRDGDHLTVHVEVPFYEAILGSEIKVPTLEKKLSMKIPVCTQNGQKFRLNGKGLPNLNSSKGNLYVIIDVQLPKSIDHENTQLIQEFKNNIEEKHAQ